MLYSISEAVVGPVVSNDAVRCSMHENHWSLYKFLIRKLSSSKRASVNVSLVKTIGFIEACVVQPPTEVICQPSSVSWYDVRLNWLGK